MGSGWRKSRRCRGRVSQGATKPQAIANIREAIEGWIETASAHGQTIPDEDF